MKKILFFLIVFLSIQFVFSQANDSEIYSSVGIDVKPEFPGGISAFYKFIGDNYKSPDLPGLKGKVYLSFVIEKDGKVNEIKVLRDIGHGTGDEAMRILNLCPNWLPGEQNGQKVRCMYSIPIAIDIPNLNPTYTFKEVEIKPEFPGGMSEFNRFIAKNYQPPLVEGLSGKIYITFVIEIDGTLDDIRVLRDIGSGSGKEAIRVLKLSPKWKPGLINENPVRCIFSLPIQVNATVSKPATFKNY